MQNWIFAFGSVLEDKMLLAKCQKHCLSFVLKDQGNDVED